MNTTNMSQKIQTIKHLFNNIRDTFSRREINEIRTKIYKKEALYDFLSQKDKLASKE